MADQKRVKLNWKGIGLITLSVAAGAGTAYAVMGSGSLPAGLGCGLGGALGIVLARALGGFSEVR